MIWRKWLIEAKLCRRKHRSNDKQTCALPKRRRRRWASLNQTCQSSRSKGRRSRLLASLGLVCSFEILCLFYSLPEAGRAQSEAERAKIRESIVANACVFYSCTSIRALRRFVVRGSPTLLLKKEKTGYGVGERASTDFGMSMRRESDREGDIGTYICGNKRDVTWIQEEGEEEEANWHILSYNYLG